MRNRVLNSAILLMAIIGLVSCESVELDNEKPVIAIISPTEDDFVRPGSEIHLDIKLSDNEALASYKVNIHGAFDGHDHGKGGVKSAKITADGESLEFSKTWLENDFIALGEVPIAGKREATIRHHHIEIPETVKSMVNGVQKDMPLREGHYHFIIYCTDKSGQESFASTEVFISYDAEADDHIH
jgi:hypothetical protein